MKICLYTTITALNENKPRHRGPWRTFKDYIKRTRDQIRWHLDLDREFDFNAWSTHSDSNRGDMAIRQAVQSQFLRVFGSDTEFLECAWGSLNDRTVDEINRTCDIFVVSGGGYLFIEDDGSLGNGRLEIDNKYLEKISCPKVAFGVGLNQVLSLSGVAPAHFNDEAAEVVRVWLRNLDLVAVRDQETLAALQQVGGRPVHMIGDPALFLERTRPQVFKQSHLGINFAVHGQLAKALFSQNFQQYSAILKELQTRGYMLHYFQHSDTDPVAVRMFRREGIEMSMVDAAPGDLPELYAGMEFVICQMLHSAILATGAAVPSINIAYDRKNFAFYDLFDMSDLCIRYDKLSLDWLLARIEKVKRERAAISESITSKKRSLVEKQLAFLNAIKAISDRRSCRAAN